MKLYCWILTRQLCEFQPKVAAKQGPEPRTRKKNLRVASTTQTSDHLLMLTKKCKNVFRLLPHMCLRLKILQYTTWKVDGATPMYWFIMAPC